METVLADASSTAWADSSSTWTTSESAPASLKGPIKGQGVLQHQVRVKFEAGGLAHGRDDWQPKADVGDEVPVHYVEMEKISPAALDAADVLG